MTRDFSIPGASPHSNGGPCLRLTTAKHKRDRGQHQTRDKELCSIGIKHKGNKAPVSTTLLPVTWPWPDPSLNFRAKGTQVSVSTECVSLLHYRKVESLKLNPKSGTLCGFVPELFLSPKSLLKFWLPGSSVIPVPRLVKYSFLPKTLLSTMTLVLLASPGSYDVLLSLQSGPKKWLESELSLWMKHNSSRATQSLQVGKVCWSN